MRKSGKEGRGGGGGEREREGGGYIAVINRGTSRSTATAWNGQLNGEGATDSHARDSALNSFETLLLFG